MLKTVWSVYFGLPFLRETAYSFIIFIASFFTGTMWVYDFVMSLVTVHISALLIMRSSLDKVPVSAKYLYHSPFLFLGPSLNLGEFQENSSEPWSNGGRVYWP